MTQNSRLCAAHVTGLEYNWIAVKLGYSGKLNPCVYIVNE